MGSVFITRQVWVKESFLGGGLVCGCVDKNRLTHVRRMKEKHRMGHVRLKWEKGGGKKDTKLPTW